jgi:hypothetical protein
MTKFRILAAALAVFLVACGDVSDTPPASPTPGVPPSVVEPSSTAPPAPVATQTPDMPSGTETGIPAIDAVIAAVMTGDSIALRELMQLRAIGCTNEMGIGGPPQCRQASGGAAPDGTPIDVFPLSVCEIEWLTDETLQLFLDDVFFSREYELYAVVTLDFDAPLFDVEYLPTPEYGVIFSYDRPEVSDRGAMVVLEDDRVTFLTILCDGAPRDFLTGHPLYSERAELILLGPAFP